VVELLEELVVFIEGDDMLSPLYTVPLLSIPVNVPTENLPPPLPLFEVEYEL
jgi:hypothetical protein